jgi:hypothetical protein
VHAWEDNIKIELKERRCEDMDWNYLTQDRVQLRVLVNIVMNLKVP